jgi:hypothetical protein
MRLSFGGHEMAQGVNGTEARSCGPRTQRSLSGKVRSRGPDSQRSCKLTQEQNTGDGESYVDVVNKP